jgi:hypothetical protein
VTPGGDGGRDSSTDSGSPKDAGHDVGSKDAGNDAAKIPIDGFAWATSFQAGNGSTIMAMASDATSIVLVGQLMGSATFGATKLVAPDSGGNAFVVKLDLTGAVVWAQVATGDNSDFETVAIDSSGNVIVAGEDFGDGAGFTFGGSTLGPNLTAPINGKPPSAGGGVLLLMDSAGDVMWSKFVDTTGEVNMSSLAVTSSAIYVAGPIIDDADFSNGAGPYVDNCGTKGCVFLATFDTAGNIQTAVIAPSTPHRGTGVDPREVWLAATSTALTMAIGGFYSSAGGETNDTNQLVVNQYDLTGKLVWSRSSPVKGGGSPALNGLVVDAMGNAYVAGEMSPGLTLGPLKDTNGQFLAEYSSTGSVTWAIQNVGEEEFGINGLALGDHLYTFGNGDLENFKTPSPDTSMSLDIFDPKTGAIIANAPCGAAHGFGVEVTAGSGGVFISGEGGPTGVFGTHELTAEGFFVAKLAE